MSTPLLPWSIQTCKTSTTMENLQAIISKFANSHPQTPFTPSQMALLQKKLLLAFPVFHTPTHPTYTVMIENAINKLDEVDGSTEESISKYIKENYDGLPWAHAAYLSHHLKKLCEDGEIVLNSASKCYNISARAGVKDCKTPEKQPIRVCLRRKRKESGVDLVEKGEKNVIAVSENLIGLQEGAMISKKRKRREKNVIAASENLIGLQEDGTMMSEKCKTKRRRCLVLKDDDGEVGGKTNVGDGEQNKLVVERPEPHNEAVAVCYGDDLLKEGNEHGIVTAIQDDPSTVGILDKISECAVTANLENVDEDNISATELMGVPVKSVGKSFSTLCRGIDDSELNVEDLDLKAPKLMNVPFEGNTVISAADGKTTKKERPKVTRVNKKVSSESMTSSSDLAVGHNLLEYDQIHDRLLSQRGLETKNLEHHKEDQERQGCGNNFRLEYLNANQPISYPNCDQELKVKLEDRPRKRFEVSTEYSEPLSPQNIEQNNKELKKSGLFSHRIQLKKSGQGRLWKCMEVAEGDTTLSILHHQEESSELATIENSPQQVMRLSKRGRKRLQKPLESPSVQQINRLEKEDRENHFQEDKQLRKAGRGRPRKKEQVKEDSASLSVPLNVVWELEEGLSDQEKEHKDKVFEQSEFSAQNQEEYKGEVGFPKKKGRGRPRKNKDPAATKNLDLQVIKQAKKARGRPRKQKPLNNEDSAGLSDPLNVVDKLEKGLPYQANELQADAHEQFKTESQKPNLSNGSCIEPEKSQSEVSMCVTQLRVPLTDIDEKGNLLAQKQEEGEFEDEAELPKVESETATMSSKYPLRSRVNHQSHVLLSSKDQLFSMINNPSQ